MEHAKIDWELGEQMEILKGDWAVYAITGYDKQGNKYEASCQTSISDPEIDNIDDVELVETCSERDFRLFGEAVGELKNEIYKVIESSMLFQWLVKVLAKKS